MAKQGIINDYDLMANREPSAHGNSCVVCEDSPMSYQWSDYSGQAMCCRCGTPYQLKWGSDEQVAEGAYPYLGLKEEWVPIVRQYHQETGLFSCLGMMLGHAPGKGQFFDWVKKSHPEMMAEGSAD